MSLFARAVASGLSDLERHTLTQIMWGEQFDLPKLDAGQFECALRSLLARFGVADIEQLKKFVHQAASDEISNAARQIRADEVRRGRFVANYTQLKWVPVRAIVIAAAVIGKIPLFLGDF